MSAEFKKSLIEHKAVIWGLLNREITTKFGDSYFGYAWIVIEPMLFIIMFYAMYTFLGRSTGNMSILLFLLTGIIPFFFFRNSFQGASGAISANQSLLAYRQVKIIDTILARILLQAVTSAISTIILTALIIYLNSGTTIYHPIRIIYIVFILLALTLGGSLILAVISYYYIDLPKFMGIVNRILFFTSGVFFSLNDFPPNIAYYLSFNPILQIIEFIRSAFSVEHLNTYLSYNYLITFTICTLFLGILCYYVARKNIIMNARSR
ncbi:ABC transporter permease [Francisella sciaenopsi]|uniref:ABC transporter permease n=1 Tax=Francisella sciaenopsi TaxID=3055034 RepID=UPI0038B3E8FC